MCQALARELEVEMSIFSMDAYLGQVLDALTEGGVEASKKRWKEYLARTEPPKRKGKTKKQTGGDA